MSSDTAKQIMDKYLKSSHQDKVRLNNPAFCDATNEKGRLSQIELINIHQPTMNAAELKTADWVLKQIGG